MKYNVLHLLFTSIALAVLSGCSLMQTAPPAYKSANQYRFSAVEPWLRTFATEHPNESQRVTDLLTAWKIEIEAQQHSDHP